MGPYYFVTVDIDNYLDAGEEVLKGKGDKLKPIEKVIIFIGGNTRNGITPEDSERIWNIYKKYLFSILKFSDKLGNDFKCVSNNTVVCRLKERCLRIVIDYYFNF